MMKEIEYIFQELFDLHKCSVNTMYQLTEFGRLYPDPQIGINTKYYSVYFNIEKDINLLSETFNIIKRIKEINNISLSMVTLDDGTLDIIITYLDKSNSIKITKLDLIYNQCVKSQIKSEYDGKVIKLYLDYIDYHHSVSYLNAFVESIKDLYDNIDVCEVSNPSQYRNVYYISEKKLLFTNINRF